MSKFLQQAPETKFNGEKMRDNTRMGKAMRTHELEAAFANCLGDRDFVAYKVMMFYTGNAEGFKVAEKTICDRCNISSRAYTNARKKLAEMKWITDIKGDSITINYNKIYNDYYTLLAAKGDEVSSSQKNTETNQGMKSVHPVEMKSVPKGDEVSSERGSTEFIHNNINNNIIIDKEKDNVISCASLRSAPPAASGGGFFQKIKEVESKLYLTGDKNKRYNMLDNLYYDVSECSTLNQQEKEQLIAQIKPLYSQFCW